MRRNRAEKLQARGWAKISKDGRSVRITHFHDWETAEYDNAVAFGVARLDQIERLPCLKPAKALTIPSKRPLTRNPRHGKVKVLVQDGLPVAA